MKAGRKLIEVALPLEAINKASARETDFEVMSVGYDFTGLLAWAEPPA